eukprot:1160505-Pelagomonas_calceolata.AAC.1
MCLPTSATMRSTLPSFNTCAFIIHAYPTVLAVCGRGCAIGQERRDMIRRHMVNASYASSHATGRCASGKATYVLVCVYVLAVCGRGRAQPGKA